jgi:FKBP-type peptidyl-prolyl cis-trans isomerase (trigger factor)
MVDQVIDSMIQEMQWPSEDQRKRALHDQELRKSCLASARRKAQNTLILWRVAQAEKLEITEDDIRKHLTERMGAGSDPKQLDSLVRSLGPRIKENLIFDKAMEFLISSATVTDIPAKI